MIDHLLKALPLVAVIAVVVGIAGWWLRALMVKATSQPLVSEPTKQEKVKNLEIALEKSRSSHKATKTELDELKAGSVSRQELDAAIHELQVTRETSEMGSKRAASLETELKKSQETIKSLNTRANEMEKAQKDRSFQLENELSKARQDLAQFENRPDDSGELRAEIERLRESVASLTRYSGELRKKEAAAVEALEKAKASFSRDSAKSPMIPEKPAGDSDRVAAAKAEVLRILEQNRLKQSEQQPSAPEVPAHIAEEVKEEIQKPAAEASVEPPPTEQKEEAPPAPEPALEPSAVEDTAEKEAPAAPAKKQSSKSGVPVTGELFTLE